MLLTYTEVVRDTVEVDFHMWLAIVGGSRPSTGYNHAISRAVADPMVIFTPVEV